MSFQPDVIYTNLEFFINPNSSVPVVFAQLSGDGHSRTFFVPCNGKLVRLVDVGEQTDLWFFRTGSLNRRTISYSKNDFSGFTPNVNVEHLRWYLTLDITDPEKLEKAMSACPVAFSYTDDKFFEHLSWEVISNSYKPPKGSIHNRVRVHKYLKAYMGE